LKLARDQAVLRAHIKCNSTFKTFQVKATNKPKSPKAQGKRFKSVVSEMLQAHFSTNPPDCNTKSYESQWVLKVMAIMTRLKIRTGEAW
jgi:hypothetical protein